MVLVAVLVQWGWANYTQETIWWRALAGADPGSNVNEILQQVLIFNVFLPTYPFDFFRPLTALFFFLGLIGILGVMGAAALAVGRSRSGDRTESGPGWRS